MNEKKTAEEAAYKFAEVILGQPAFDKDDTIVVGFLGGVEYAAQETAALREENERLKYWLRELLFFYENNSGPEYHQFSIRQIKKLIADLLTEEPQPPQPESE